MTQLYIEGTKIEEVEQLSEQETFAMHFFAEARKFCAIKGKYSYVYRHKFKGLLHELATRLEKTGGRTFKKFLKGEERQIMEDSFESADIIYLSNELLKTTPDRIARIMIIQIVAEVY